MSKNISIKWLEEPEEKNYPAAESYLSLIYEMKTVELTVSKLRSAKTEQFKAKDIFRATRLSLLGISNDHVEKDREKNRAR
jgi:hypothetical protein